MPPVLPSEATVALSLVDLSPDVCSSCDRRSWLHFFAFCTLNFNAQSALVISPQILEEVTHIQGCLRHRFWGSKHIKTIKSRMSKLFWITSKRWPSNPLCEPQRWKSHEKRRCMTMLEVHSGSQSGLLEVALPSIFASSFASFQEKRMCCFTPHRGHRWIQDWNTLKDQRETARKLRGFWSLPELLAACGLRGNLQVLNVTT